MHLRGLLLCLVLKWFRHFQERNSRRIPIINPKERLEINQSLKKAQETTIRKLFIKESSNLEILTKTCINYLTGNLFLAHSSNRAQTEVQLRPELAVQTLQAKTV